MVYFLHAALQNRARNVALATLILETLNLVVGKGNLPKVISNYPKELWVSTGETIRLSCPVVSDSEETKPMITWQKDDDVIGLGWERFKTKSELLLIKDVEIGDSGIYVCTATNGFGTVSAQYKVCILGNETVHTTVDANREIICGSNTRGESPTFVNFDGMQNNNLELMTGDTADLICQATGKPKPEIHWLKDGKALLENRNSGSSGSSGLLKLSDVTEESSGHYTCSAVNRFGNINFTYTVKVFGNKVGIPEFYQHMLKNVTVSAGKSASFLCQVHSNSDVHIQWLKQVKKGEHKVNLTISLRENEHYTVVQSGLTQSRPNGWYLSKLTLHSVTENDAGLYVCSASNSDGFGFRTAFLKVLQDLHSYGDVTQDFGGTSQFVPLVAAIVAIFGVLCVGIVICIVHRRCISIQSSSPAALHQHFPSTFSPSDVKCYNPCSTVEQPDIYSNPNGIQNKCKQNLLRVSSCKTTPPNSVLPPLSQQLLLRQQELHLRYYDDC